MQSAELTYARYMFLKEKGIEITVQDHKKLYIDDKVFEKRFGITKKLMLKKYNYEEYLENQSKRS